MTRLRTTLIFRLIMCITIITVLCDCVLADSLWRKRVTVNYNLYDDNRAKRVGDIVTIDVKETTNILNTETNTTNNSSKNSADADSDRFFAGIMHQLYNGRNAKFTARDPNQFETNYTADFSGKGSNDIDRSVTVTITAIVVEVLDNGNLVLEGKRDVEVNKEKYTLKITGIARPIDISTTNKIDSDKLSNVNFGLEGKGWVTRAGAKGWYNRVRDMLWPF